MKIYAWLGPFLLTGALSADPPAYVISTAAGYIPGTTPVALQQHLVQPVVVAYDANGNLYYGSEHQVWRLNADGTDTLIAGAPVTGTGSSCSSVGDGGPATSACLSWVGGLAVDGQQNVYISDIGTYEIRKVTPGGLISRFAGTGAGPYFSGQSNAAPGMAAQNVWLNPGPLAIDSANLYASDAATSSVLSFSLDGRNSKVVAGNHGSKTAGDAGLAVNASLFYPGSLAVANNILSINEAGGARVRQVTFRTGVITTLVQLAQTFLTDNGNEGLAADSDGTVYVQYGNTVQRICPNTTTPQPYAGGGNANPGDSRPALEATLFAPTSLAVNPVTHDLALADLSGNLVEVVSGNTGAIQTVAGMVHFAGDNGPAALAIFNGLEGVVSDAQGNVYVADVANNRIRRIDTAGIVTTVAGTGIMGFSGDGGPASAAALSLKHTAQFANNLAIDVSGNLYVSDYGNGRIRMIDTTGVITTVAGGGRAAIARGTPATSAALQPGPLTVDSEGNLYFGNVVVGTAPTIATVYKIDGTGQLSVFAGGVGSVAESGPAVTLAIGYASCLTVDSLDNLYICDSVNNRVRKVSNGIMSTVAGNGQIPGAAVPSIASGAPTTIAIGSPTAVTVDASGNLYIYSQRQITEIDGTGVLQPFAGLNTLPQVSGGDGGYASQATFTSVAGMSFDPFGNLYLCDAGVYVREALPVGSGGPPPIISSGGIVGAGASNPPVQAVSAGAIVSIFGSNFAPSGVQSMLTAASMLSGKIPTSLGGICVSFGGVKAPITGVFPNQVNVQVPQLPAGPVTVQVIANCGGSTPIAGNLGAVAVDTASPEFFSSPDPVSGRSMIAAVNIAGGPITAGATVEAYGTGWGATTPAIAPGAIPGTAAALTTPPVLLLGGVAIPAGNLLYAGASPCCAGLYQVDFTVPAGTAPGPLPLVITVNGIPSPFDAYLTLY